MRPSLVALSSASIHPKRSRLDPSQALKGSVEDHEMVAADVEPHERITRFDHNECAGAARRTTGRRRPLHRRPIRLGRIGGRQHDGLGHTVGMQLDIHRLALRAESIDGTG
ncbi:MAG: hypothetical protein EBT21_07270 [Actinobacteria bacterium]|nr:hypothetical protein [Actinomycetota bacterium]